MEVFEEPENLSRLERDIMIYFGLFSGDGLLMLQLEEALDAISGNALYA